MAQLTFPDNPSSGEIYTAENGITYRYDDTAFPGGVGVWLVDVPSAALSVTSGSIAGATTVGSVLTYTQGVASGGTPTYSYTQQWYRDGAIIPGATLLNYTVAAADLGKALTVTITATDSATPTPAQATATTAPFNIPAPSVLTITSPGTITGTAASGSTLTYSPGSATGGTGTINYTWVWKRASDNSVLQSPGTTTYQIPLGLVGDNVYVTLTATDSATPTPAQASADTPDYPTSGTITATPFPGLTFSPSTGPTAAPASVNAGALQGTATATWPSTPSPATLTLTGDIQISIAGSAFQGAAGNPFSISSGQSIAVIWDPTAVANAAHNATLTGAIEDATYKTTFSMVVSRSPVWPTIPPFADLDPEPLTTVKTSNTVAPTGFNVPVTLTVAGTASNPLASFGAAVAPGGFGSAPQPVNPGQTIQLQGTTGGAINTTYGMTVSLGSATGTPATDTWTVKTVTALPSVTTPQILTPNAGTTGQGTAAGITITSDAFASANGAGTTHTSSDWELYANSYPLTSTQSISTASLASSPWTAVASATNYFGIAVGTNKIYAVSGAPAARVSTDNGSTWSNATLGASIYYTIAADGIRWVNAGQTPGVDWLVSVSSDDGASWTARSVANTKSLHGAFVKGDEIALYGGGSGPSGRISTDFGASWTNTTFGLVGNDKAYVMVYNTVSNQYLVLGYESLIGNVGKIQSSSSIGGAYSTVYQTPTTFVLPRSLVTSSGATVASYWSNGAIVASTDGGVTWTTVSTVTSSDYSRLIRDEALNLWVLVGQSKAAYSSNLVTWTNFDPSSSFGVTPQSVTAANNGSVLVLGANNIFQNVSPNGLSSLTIAGCQADGFQVGDAVVSDPGAAASGTIVSVDNTNVTVAPYSASWASGQFIKRNPASYTLAASATADTINLVSWPVAKPPLAANTTYYTRVRYTSSAIITTSDWSPWRKFTTGALLPGNGSALLSTIASATIPLGSRPFYDGTNYAVGGTPPSAPSLVYYSADLNTWNSSPLTGSFANGGYVMWNGTKWVGTANRGSSDSVYTSSGAAGPWSLAGVSATWGGWALPVSFNPANGDTISAENGTWGISTNAGSNYTVYSVAGLGQPGSGGGTYFNGAYLSPTNNGNGLIIRSTTGTSGSWSTVFGPSATVAFISMASSPTISVAVSQSEAIYYSTTGLTWTSTGVGTSQFFSSVAYGAGVFMAVGNGTGTAKVWVSSDGIAWVDKTTAVGISDPLVGVNYLNGRWIAVSSNGKVYQIT